MVLRPFTRHAEWIGPLRGRDFRLLFLARSLSSFGSALSPVALAFAIIATTGSASDLGIVLATMMLSRVLFVLAGGVWSDRLPRHHVMVATNLAQGAAQTVLGVAVLRGEAPIWLFIVVAAINGSGSAFFGPASQGIIPELTPAPRLQQANALLRLSLNSTQIGGAAAGGLLVASAGPGWALIADAATFFASGALLVRIALARRARLDTPNFVYELREGWTAFRSKTWLWVTVGAFALINAALTGPFLVLGPLVASRELGGAAGWGLILSGYAAGLVCGGFIALRIRPPYPLRTGMLWILLRVAPVALLAGHAPLLLVVAGAVAAGVGVEIFSVLWDTTLQQHLSTDVLSRVSAYDSLGSLVFMPLSYAVAGPLAEATNASATLWGSAAVAIVIVVIALMTNDVRKVSALGGRVAAPAVDA